MLAHKLRRSGGTFPQVVTTNTFSHADARSTSSAVSLPGSLVSGNLIVILLVVENGVSVTTPGGWSNLTPYTAGDPDLHVLYKTSNGSEGASVSVTHDNSGSAAVSLQVSRFQGAPELGGGANGTSTAPNPGSLSPSWGSARTLWIPVYGTLDSENVAPTGYPYAGNNLNANTNGNCQIAACTTEVHAASLDSGTFTISSMAWVAATVAVRPA